MGYGRRKEQIAGPPRIAAPPLALPTTGLAGSGTQALVER